LTYPVHLLVEAACAEDRGSPGQSGQQVLNLMGIPAYDLLQVPKDPDQKGDLDQVVFHAASGLTRQTPGTPKIPFRIITFVKDHKKPPDRNAMRA